MTGGCSYEYWGRSAALVHVTPDGTRDARIADDTRVYTFTGLQRFPRGFPPEVGTGDLKGRNRQNPNPVRWYWRAMLTSMNAWVKDRVAPPPSRHPALADGTLVPLEQLRFPWIPGGVVARHPARAYRLDFGARWQRGIIDRHPPRTGKPYGADRHPVGPVCLSHGLLQTGRTGLPLQLNAGGRMRAARSPFMTLS